MPARPAEIKGPQGHPLTGTLCFGTVGDEASFGTSKDRFFLSPRCEPDLDRLDDLASCKVEASAGLLPWVRRDEDLPL